MTADDLLIDTIKAQARSIELLTKNLNKLTSSVEGLNEINILLEERIARLERQMTSNNTRQSRYGII